MKTKKLFFVLSLIIICSCSSDKVEYEIINVALPELMSKSEFRNSVEVLPPQTIDESGKIYAYDDYIFINEKFGGVHVIDNSNPESPSAISFIKIQGNVDISIKDDYLYADSSVDLLVFDISDINAIIVVERLEDVFSIYDYQIPVGAQEVDWSGFVSDDQVIVGWTITQEQREIRNNQDDIALETGGGDAATNADVGTGGSLARFQIVDDYLYTVGNHEMTIFDISNLEQPFLENTQYAGWNIETMFQADGYLYLGSTNGMYIYNLSNPSSPEYISEFIHWEGCDPVVVDGDIAYLTLRGGNDCGVLQSELEVIDISNKYNPQLIATYSLDNPYGLGFKDELLFVCDGTSGLKVYDRTNPLDIEMLTQYPDILSKDVIPLEDVLLMIGDEILYQYEYVENGVNLISTYQL